MLFFNPKVLQRSERGTFRDFNRYHVGGNAVLRAESQLGNAVRGSTIAGADVAHQGGTILFYSLTPAGTRGTFTNPDIVNGAAVAYEPGTPRSVVVSFSLGRGR